jgi:RNA recognition motif-containing protein
VIVKNPQTGQSTKAGFINFASVEKATEALEAMNNRELASGQILKLAFARVSIRRSSRPGTGRPSQPGRGYGLTRSRREDGGGSYRDAGGGGYRGGGGDERQY